MRRWVGLSLIILTFSNCDALTGRPAMLRALENGCSKDKQSKPGVAKSLDCKCLTNAITRDFTDQELRLVATDEKFFTDDEWGVLIRRRASECLRPVSVAQCAGKASCVCVMDALFNEYEGDALWDIVERYQQGRAIPPEFSAVVTRCQGQR